MRHWTAIALALAVGLVLLAYDRRTDDTGIEVGLLLISAFALAVAAPRAMIAVALAIGLPITVLNGGAPALAFSTLGATLGYALARGLREERSLSRPG